MTEKEIIQAVLAELDDIESHSVEDSRYPETKEVKA